MWDGRLEPRFLPGSLCEPWPDCRDVQDAQILEQNASAEAQGLNDKVIEKVVCRSRKVVGQDRGNVTGSINDLGNDIGDAGRDCRDQHKLDEEKGEVEVLRDNLAFTTRRCAHEDRQLSHQCRYDKLN